MEKNYMANHCWHWGRNKEAPTRVEEVCCNCGKIMDDDDRGKTNLGKCEWR